MENCKLTLKVSYMKIIRSILEKNEFVPCSFSRLKKIDLILISIHKLSLQFLCNMR